MRLFLIAWLSVAAGWAAGLDLAVRIQDGASSTNSKSSRVTISALTNLNTGSLVISNMTSELLKASSAGAVEEAVAGTDYQIPLSAISGATQALGNGSQSSVVWTFNLSGATDPALTAANALLSISTPLDVVVGTSDATAIKVRGGSVTGSGTTILHQFSGTENTSGNATFFELKITNSAWGGTGRAFSILGGASGATDLMYVDRNGALYAVSTITSGGSTGSGILNGNGLAFTGRGGFRASADGVFYFLSNAGLTFTSLALGPDDSSPNDATLKGSSGVGTDIVGGALTIAGGQSTGTGAPGKVLAKRSIVGTTGSSANAYGTSFSLGGTLNVNTTTTGNVGAGEDDLITYSIPAAQLSVNGDHIEFDVWGTFAADAHLKTLKIYFGSQVLLNTTSLVFNNLDWRGHGKIVRTGAATQTATCEFTVGGTLLSSVNGTITDTTAPTETLSGAVTFKVTGQDDDGTPSSNAVVQNGSVVKYYTSP